jgi:hypothetical protein
MLPPGLVGRKRWGTRHEQARLAADPSPIRRVAGGEPPSHRLIDSLASNACSFSNRTLAESHFKPTVTMMALRRSTALDEAIAPCTAKAPSSSCLNMRLLRPPDPPSTGYHPWRASDFSTASVYPLSGSSFLLAQLSSPPCHTQ